MAAGRGDLCFTARRGGIRRAARRRPQCGPPMPAGLASAALARPSAAASAPGALMTTLKSPPPMDFICALGGRRPRPAAGSPGTRLARGRRKRGAAGSRRDGIVVQGNTVRRRRRRQLVERQVPSMPAASSAVIVRGDVGAGLEEAKRSADEAPRQAGERLGDVAAVDDLWRRPLAAARRRSTACTARLLSKISCSSELVNEAHRA